MEAKPLGQNLDDRKWANQIMGYASVDGVKWVVLTDGDEYRLYNSHAPVPIEENLFRTVRVTDSDTRPAETLALLSKSRIQENEIELLWQAQFVDRQVRSAVEQLFATDPDPDSALVRLVKKRVHNLSSKDVRASLRRARIQFDFPIEPTMVSAARIGKPGAKRKPKTQKFRGTTGKFLDAGIAMKDVAAVLIREGFLKAPLKLTAQYRGSNLEATLETDGKIVFHDKKYETPSGAVNAALATVAGRPVSYDGWYYWHYQNDNGERVRLDVARQAFLKSQQGN